MPSGSPGPLTRWLRALLAEPRLLGADVDSSHFVDLHREILLGKPVMLQVFREFYDAVVAADERYLGGAGARVELGAGSSLFRKFHPKVLSTDLKAARGLQAVVDAQAMPFRRHAVRALYGIHCFHHFPEPNRFFDELVRLLPPGGGCVLIEPYHGPVAAAFFRRLFASERFDRTQKDWASEAAGPMTGANQALSFIVFTRDKAKFERRYPTLELVRQLPLTNYPRYVLSGGLNFRSLIPSALAPMVRAAEWLLAPFAPWLALHHLIVLRRRTIPESGVEAS